jgi:hypothetical protein
MQWNCASYVGRYLMSNLLPIALRFLAQGISVVPTANDGSKRPAFAWQGFQEHLPIADELLMWFKDGVDGIGVITVQGIRQP